MKPVPGLTNFVFLPWAGFVFSGTIIGMLLDNAETSEDERRLNVWFGLLGAALAVAAYAASFLPSPYSSSYFWTTSPTYFFLRAGLMTSAIALAYLWQARPGGTEKWSPMQQLGRTSLFIYWIHVEMVYGLISLPLHKSLSWSQAWFAFACFSIFMLFCSIAKDRVVGWWRTPATTV